MTLIDLFEYYDSLIDEVDRRNKDFNKAKKRGR
jgi:hypothetical protein